MHQFSILRARWVVEVDEGKAPNEMSSKAKHLLFPFCVAVHRIRPSILYRLPKELLLMQVWKVRTYARQVLVTHNFTSLQFKICTLENTSYIQASSCTALNCLFPFSNLLCRCNARKLLHSVSRWERPVLYQQRKSRI